MTPSRERIDWTDYGDYAGDTISYEDNMTRNTSSSMDKMWIGGFDFGAGNWVLLPVVCAMSAVLMVIFGTALIYVLLRSKKKKSHNSPISKQKRFSSLSTISDFQSEIFVEEDGVSIFEEPVGDYDPGTPDLVKSITGLETLSRASSIASETGKSQRKSIVDYNDPILVRGTSEEEKKDGENVIQRGSEPRVDETDCPKASITEDQKQNY